MREAMKITSTTGRPRALCTAVLGAAALWSGAALAQSSVDLYGQVDAWVGTQKFPGSQRAWVQQGGGMSTSYWGMTGKEDLGDGYKAVFKLEGFFLPQTGAYGRFHGDSFFSRNAYVGVEAPWGTVTAGRLTTQLFVSTILFNPFSDSYVFSPMVYHTFLGLGTFPTYSTDLGVVGDSGWDNAVQYTTPSFGGLTGSAMYAFGNSAGSNGQHKDSVQLLYFHGPFAATAVYQYVNFNSAANDLGSVLTGLTSQSVGQVGATYDFKFVKLYGQYMRTKTAVTTGNININTGQLGVTVPVGPGTVMASYAYSKGSGGMDQNRKSWALGYDYPLSKRTDVYAAYLSDKLSGQSNGDTLGVGIRAKF
jgi:predicted porin